MIAVMTVRVDVLLLLLVSVRVDGNVRWNGRLKMRLLCLELLLLCFLCLLKLRLTLVLLWRLLQEVWT
jgi:hypothetical protein